MNVALTAEVLIEWGIPETSANAYAEKLREADIILKILSQLTDERMVALGINSLGHRMIIEEQRDKRNSANLLGYSHTQASGMQNVYHAQNTGPRDRAKRLDIVKKLVLETTMEIYWALPAQVRVLPTTPCSSPNNP